MQSSKPILFPTDFQSHSQAAFEHAERLAASSGSTLIVVHVCNMPDMPWSTCSGMTHHEDLKSKLKLLDSSRVPIERVFRVADPGPEICQLAEDFDCGMIVMGITNKCGSDQFLCGSVHHLVEKNAKCPLVTLCQQPQKTTASQW